MKNKKKKKKESTIYCWKCGLKNPKNRWHCKDENCRTNLKEKDHPIIYWLFGEIKEDINDNMFEYVCNLFKDFFKLHLYGVSMGAAIIFTVTATITNINTEQKPTITEKEYYISNVEEVKESSPTTENKKEEQEEKQEEKKESTKSEKTTTTTKKKYCPSGYTMRSDGKCESETYTDAYLFQECEQDFHKEKEGSETFCASDAPYATTNTTYTCVSTISDYIADYGSDSCIDQSSSIVGTLINHSQCSYTYYDSNGSKIDCSVSKVYLGRLIEETCPDGMYKHAYYCYLKTSLVDHYYCFDESIMKYVLNPDNSNKCRKVIEASEK